MEKKRLMYERPQMDVMNIEPSGVLCGSGDKKNLETMNRNFVVFYFGIDGINDGGDL
jgi:hypothetical protein